MPKTRNILVIRLSSLGDVILSSAVLESPALSSVAVDWVVAREFAPVLQGHPKLRELKIFNRKQGLLVWLRQSWRWACSDYDEVWDLHGSLRSRILRAVFFAATFASPDRKRTVFRVIPKQRLRFGGHFIFKSLWPRAWRPKAWLEIFARLAGVEVSHTTAFALRPRLDHLAISSEAALEAKVTEGLGTEAGLLAMAVMPSSAWRSKEWPSDRWMEVFRQGRGTFVPWILGTPNDLTSLELARRLKEEGIPHRSFVGRLELGEVAALLRRADLFVGVDTGLYHLASALGLRSHVILGPTTEDCGYPAWAPRGGAIGVNLACRPCGKNGKRCHRIQRKQLCLTSLSSERVLTSLKAP